LQAKEEKEKKRGKNSTSKIYSLWWGNSAKAVWPPHHASNHGSAWQQQHARASASVTLIQGWKTPSRARALARAEARRLEALYYTGVLKKKTDK